MEYVSLEETIRSGRYLALIEQKGKSFSRSIFVKFVDVEIYHPNGNMHLYIARPVPVVGCETEPGVSEERIIEDFRDLERITSIKPLGPKAAFNQAYDLLQRAKKYTPMLNPFGEGHTFDDPNNRFLRPPYEFMDSEKQKEGYSERLKLISTDIL